MSNFNGITVMFQMRNERRVEAGGLAVGGFGELDGGGSGYMLGTRMCYYRLLLLLPLLPPS